MRCRKVYAVFTHFGNWNRMRLSALFLSREAAEEGLGGKDGKDKAFWSIEPMDVEDWEDSGE